MITPEELVEIGKVGQVYREYRNGVETKFFIHICTSRHDVSGATFWRTLQAEDMCPNVGWTYTMGFASFDNSIIKLKLIFPKKKYPQRKSLTI